MKIALCSTTVHIPHTLHLLRKCNVNVKFFVAGDEKSPHMDIIANQAGLGEYDYLLPGVQEKWKCSAVIGWNCIQRRNIAFLEALKWGADVIYSWDTDNLPVSRTHFDHIEFRLEGLFSGLKVSGDDGWFDPGFLLVPRTKHRGIPHDTSRMVTIDQVINAKVGVVAGLVIGDPDIDSTTRMELHPDIQSVSELAKAGVVVNSGCWTVWNSQNTAMMRELIPAWFMAPGVGRYDDIFASLIVQRVMRERGHHVYFGQPLAYQQRHPHDLLKDLRAEIGGMNNIKKMADLLDHVVLPGKSVIADTRIIYEMLAHAEWYPKQAVIAALAYLYDCEDLGLCA